MELLPYELLLLDTSSHSVLLADGLSGEIIKELLLPDGYSPVDIIAVPQIERAYISLAGDNGVGAVCELNLPAKSLRHIPQLIPHPVQIAVSHTGDTLFLASPAGTLYRYDIGSSRLVSLGTPSIDSTCIGLTLDDLNLYSIWETTDGGAIAIFELDGNFIAEAPLSGKPTYINVTTTHLLVSFSGGSDSEEGLIILSKHDLANPTILITQCPKCFSIHQSSPCYITTSPDEKTAYLVNEDSTSITVIDLYGRRIDDSINIGKSISRLAVLADGNFAVASSNMFADLCLIDLVNKRPVAFTSSSRELLSPFVALSI